MLCLVMNMNPHINLDRIDNVSIKATFHCMATVHKHEKRLRNKNISHTIFSFPYVRKKGITFI